MHTGAAPPRSWPSRSRCRNTRVQAGALVLVDGAHAVGNVRGLDVPALGADFYLSNLCVASPLDEGLAATQRRLH